LEKPRAKSRFRLKDRVLCSLGLALGVFFLVLSWGFIVPVEDLIRKKILGDLPDRVQVSKTSVSMGPLAFGGTVDEKTVAEVKADPRVLEVYRQAHFPDPCQLRASYAGESLVTDLVLEMVEPGQVEGEVAPGYSFSDPGPGQPVPALMPRAILDLVNSGISVNTDLPHITESALIGKGFDLYVGTSSFRPGPANRVRCVLVGVSDQIGAGGPAIPYEAGLRLTEKEPLVHSLTLVVADPAEVQAVIDYVSKLGLSAPRQELARRVSSVALLLKLFASLLPLAVLSVTAIALGAVLELQVVRERQMIALYRAVGATDRQVTLLFLVRALSVALLSLFLGVAGAMLGGRAAAHYLEGKLPADLLEGHVLFSPPLFSFLIATLFCFGLTGLAGWYPARKAARQDPAQVFREPN
jgi:ABC-type lipoprotein release transport system permease subunit